MTPRRDIFHALADPTRRAILLLLATGALTPTAIAERFDITRQAVSKHVQVLVDCAVVTPIPHGREIRYHIQPDTMADLDRWLTEFRTLLSTRFEQLDAVLAHLKRNPS